MDNTEARKALAQHLAHYRTLSYDELVGRQGRVETAELTAASGQTYQLEVQFFWLVLPPLRLEPAQELQLREQDCLLNIGGGWQALL